jgi:hypothetical protein
MKLFVTTTAMLTVVFSATGQQVPQPPNLPLLNSNVTTLTGTFNPTAPKPTFPTGSNLAAIGGCEFNFTVPEGQKAIEARFVPGGTITFDESTGTCQARFEVGQPQDAVLEWDAEQLKNAQTAQQVFAPVASAPVGNSDALKTMDARYKTSASPSGVPGYISAAGYLYAAFTDPVGLTVNSVYVGLNPFYYTPVVLPPTPTPLPFAVTNYLRTYLTTSGWSLVSESTGTGYAPYYYVQFYANDTFSNSVFPACLGGTVTASYTTASVFGFVNGQVGSGGSWNLTGPVTCIYLLSPTHRVVKTLWGVLMPRLAVVLAFLASFAWMVFPAYVPHETLLQVNGLGAILILAIPPLLSLYGLLSEQQMIAGSLLLLFCLLVLFFSGILLGLSYLPTSILLLTSPWWTVRRRKFHGAAPS